MTAPVDSYEQLQAQLARIEKMLVKGTVADRGLLRVKDVVKITGLGERTVYDLIDRGEIPTREIPDLHVTVIARTDLDAWMESLPRRSKSETQNG